MWLNLIQSCNTLGCCIEDIDQCGCWVLEDDVFLVIVKVGIGEELEEISECWKQGDIVINGLDAQNRGVTMEKIRWGQVMASAYVLCPDLLLK